MQISLGDWVAVDYGIAGSFYIGKITEVNEEEKKASASFLKKHLGDEYKEHPEKGKSIDTFTFDQVFSTELRMEYIRGGIFKLTNILQIQKLFLKHKKSRK